MQHKKENNIINQHPWKLTKIKDTTKEKGKGKGKGHSFVQEVPGKVEEEERVKMAEKAKTKAKQRKRPAQTVANVGSNPQVSDAQEESLLIRNMRRVLSTEGATYPE